MGVPHGGKGFEQETEKEKFQERGDTLRIVVADPTVLSKFFVAGGVANAKVGLNNYIWD